MTDSHTKPQVILIAGGANSRFAPLNTKTHKGFLSLLGQPIVTTALKSLEEHEFKNVTIVVSEKDADGLGFSKYLEDFQTSLNIQIKVQAEPKGMGDAILLATKDLQQQDIIVASPYYLNLGSIAEKLYQKKLDSGADCVYSATQVSNPSLYGILEFDSEDAEKIVGVVEKPSADSAPSDMKLDSIYLFDSEFITELQNTKISEYSLEKTISNHAKTSFTTWVENHADVQSLKYPWHLFDILQLLFDATTTLISNDAEIAKSAIIDTSNGPVIIADGAKIGSYAKISGPCYIGENCLVGDYSFVRGSTLEKDSVVGANTEVVRSILFEGSSVHYGYIADSIIGHETKIGAGIITANKRLDRTNVRVEIKKKLVDTQSNALGIITGEKANIGIRVNTMPGVLIGDHSSVYPGITVKRNIKPNTTATESN